MPTSRPWRWGTKHTLEGGRAVGRRDPHHPAQVSDQPLERRPSPTSVLMDLLLMIAGGVTATCEFASLFVVLLRHTVQYQARAFIENAIG